MRICISTVFVLAGMSACYGADITPLIRQLALDQPKEVRKQAAADLRARPEQSFAAIPALKRSVKSDPDHEVRIEAVQSLGIIAFQKELRLCPIELFEAWEDRNWEVRGWAVTMTGLFLLRQKGDPKGKLTAHYPPGALPILLRVAKTGEKDMRANAVLKLGYLASENKDAAKAIAAALADRNWWVRYYAHLATFNAFDDDIALLRGYVSVAAMLRRDAGKNHQLNSKKLSRTERWEISRRNLLRIGLPLQFGERARKHPKKMVAAITRLLHDKSPTVRASTVRFLGDYGAMPDAPAIDAILPGGFSLAPEQRKKVSGKRPGTWLRQHGLFKRLQEMSQNDADMEVRRSAAKAIKQNDVKASLWKPNR